MPEPRYEYTTSAVLEAPIEEVWTAVRDILNFLRINFGEGLTHAAWAAGGSAEHVPSAFTATLASGLTLHEVVTGRSESEHTLQYRAAVQVLSMVEYWAEVRLHPITHPGGQTFVVYTRWFRLDPASDPAAELPLLTGIMDQETVAMAAHFRRGRAG